MQPQSHHQGLTRAARFDANTRRPRSIPIVLTVALMLAAFSATADPETASDADYARYGPQGGEWEFALSGTGGNDNNFNGGSFGAAASLGYFWNQAVETGLRHNMVFFDSDDTDATFAATTRIFTDLHLDLGRFRPFLGANLGIRYGHGGVDEVGTAAPEVGLKFFALENTYLLAMGEYQFFFEEVKDADNNADNGEFVYTVGIGFLF